MLWTLVVLLLIIMISGSVPTWGHSRNWGYFPSGSMGMVLVIVLFLLLIGRL